jgi:hypothetical protein
MSFPNCLAGFEIQAEHKLSAQRLALGKEFAFRDDESRMSLS